MPERTIITNFVSGGSFSRTEIGHAKSGPGYFKRNILKDLFMFKSAYFKWRDLKRHVQDEMAGYEVEKDKYGKPKAVRRELSVKIAHKYGVSGLKRAMTGRLKIFNKSSVTLSKLRHKHGDKDQRTKDARASYRYDARKIGHLKLFDAIAEQMFSDTSKVYENLRGLSEKVFDNVNPNLRDDMLLAQENKLLSINAHRRRDESYGLVTNKQSRRLIRQIVASALLHHGYATAKTLKQELTKACELAERSGRRSDLSRYVEGRMSKIMEQINTGALAADTVLKDVELRNLAALAKSNLTERIPSICRNVSRRDRRRVIEKALFQVAAKGGINAAHKFLNLLKGEKRLEQLDLAAKTTYQLQNAKPKEPHYMYLPFKAASGGIDGNLESGLSKYRDKPHFAIIDREDSHGLPKKPLRVVDPHHVVLIQGHGDYGFDGIATTSDTQVLNSMPQKKRDEAILNADRLAERLEQDGLGKNHKVIRLLTCYAGGDTLRYDSGFQGASVLPNLHDEAFAKRLAQALKQRGYRNIVVGGYPSSVHPGFFEEHKQVKAAKSNNKSGQLIVASGLCRYFDGDGNVVPNPRNLKKAEKSSVETEKMAARRIGSGLSDYKKQEFQFPVPEKPKIAPKEPTGDEDKQNLDLSKPGHKYVESLTKGKFFADTKGKSHTVPLFAERFRNFVDTTVRAGPAVDAIIGIDRLTSMPLADNNDNGANAVKAFKEALFELPEILKEAGDHTLRPELEKLIENARKTDDLNDMKKFQASRTLAGIRVSVQGAVSDYFDRFYLDLLKNPPADNEIPTVQADPGDIKIEEEVKTGP